MRNRGRPGGSQPRRVGARVALLVPLAASAAIPLQRRREPPAYVSEGPAGAGMLSLGLGRATEDSRPVLTAPGIALRSRAPVFGGGAVGSFCLGSNPPQKKRGPGGGLPPTCALLSLVHQVLEEKRERKGAGSPPTPHAPQHPADLPSPRARIPPLLWSQVRRKARGIPHSLPLSFLLLSRQKTHAASVLWLRGVAEELNPRSLSELPKGRLVGVTGLPISGPRRAHK